MTLWGRIFVTVNVNNNDKDNYYGLESWTETADPKHPSQSLSNSSDHTFMVSPKFTTVAPNKQASLRIIELPNIKLPQDRESLFYLYFQEAPPKLDIAKYIPTDKSSAVSALQIVLRAKIKLIYRPKGIPSLNNQALTGKIKATIVKGFLELKNNSPYVLTLVGISRQKNKLLSEPMILLPFTTKGLMLSTSQLATKKSMLILNYIDDTGINKQLTVPNLIIH